MILGIDEVGRGPWAGPLVVGAVVLGGVVIEGLTDSKKLTKKRREALDVEIRKQAAAYGLGWVSAAELDDIGLSEALRLATRRAVEAVDKIGVSYHEIIIDGTVNFLKRTNKGRFVTTMKKADLLVPSVSAASIIAKVARDEYMRQQGEVYPMYGFGNNAGYGVAKHRAAIERYGVTPEHRLSFAPLAKYREVNLSEVETQDGADDELHKVTATTRVIGDAGEDAAAAKLEQRGHEVIARNWRTRWCEIDIVSMKGKTLYFTEVKYRKNTQFGDGLAAITIKKQQQIHFAAELFLTKKPQYAHHEIQLLAAAVSGDPPVVQQLVAIE